jgi:hypothetical protein
MVIACGRQASRFFLLPPLRVSASPGKGGAWSGAHITPVLDRAGILSFTRGYVGNAGGNHHRNSKFFRKELTSFSYRLTWGQFSVEPTCVTTVGKLTGFPFPS